MCKLIFLFFSFVVILAGCKPSEVKTTVYEPVELTSENQIQKNVELVEIGNSQKSNLSEEKVTYKYKLGLIREKTRTEELVNYPNGPKLVPVINGYVPSVFETVYPNGEKVITYDYRSRVEYRMIQPVGKSKSEAK